MRDCKILTGSWYITLTCLIGFELTFFSYCSIVIGESMSPSYKSILIPKKFITQQLAVHIISIQLFNCISLHIISILVMAAITFLLSWFFFLNVLPFKLFISSHHFLLFLATIQQFQTFPLSLHFDCDSSPIPMPH